MEPKDRKGISWNLYPTTTNFIFMKVKDAVLVFEEMKRKHFHPVHERLSAATAGRKMENDAVIRGVDELAALKECGLKIFDFSCYGEKTEQLNANIENGKGGS